MTSSSSLLSPSSGICPRCEVDFAASCRNLAFFLLPMDRMRCRKPICPDPTQKWEYRVKLAKSKQTTSEACSSDVRDHSKRWKYSQRFLYARAQRLGSLQGQFRVRKVICSDPSQLALLLSLISSSVLLQAKFSAGEDNSATTQNDSKAGTPMATVQMAASLVAIAAGLWEYYCGIRDLR